MKKSESNRAVIENFILFYTHQNKDEATDQAKDMYLSLENYIKEDHIDGVDGDEEEMFPNGFTNWIETSVEITDALLFQLNHDLIELDGRGHLWELVEEYTNEFEKLHSETQWGSDKCFLDFFEEVESFMQEKIKQLRNVQNKI